MFSSIVIRWHKTESSMWSLMIVLLLTFFCLMSHFIQWMKQASIQNIPSNRSVLSFYKSILHRFPWLNMSKVDFPIFAPSFQAFTDEFRAIINSYRFGVNQLLQWERQYCNEQYYLYTVKGYRERNRLFCKFVTMELKEIDKKH